MAKKVAGIDISGDTLDFSGVQKREVGINNLYGDSYRLIQASGEVTIAYRAGIVNSQVYDKNGEVVALKDEFYRIPVHALAKCLFKVSSNGDTHSSSQPVSEETILAWPPGVQQALFEKLKEITPGLVQEETNEQVLENQIKDMQARLAKMRSNEDQLKN